MNDIRVSPDEENNVTLAGEYDGFAFRDAVFGTNETSTDVVYNGTPESVTVHDTGLGSGATVVARNTDTGTEIDRATVNENGSAEFTSLPDGENELDLEVGVPFFDVELLGTNSPVNEKQPVNVDVNVTNTGDVTDTQTLRLSDTGFDDEVQDTETLNLGEGEAESVTLVWETEVDDVGRGGVEVSSANDTDVAQVSVEQLLDRRDVGRGQKDQQRETSRSIGRGEAGERDDLGRESGRNKNTNRRDRGR